MAAARIAVTMVMSKMRIAPPLGCCRGRRDDKPTPSAFGVLVSALEGSQAILAVLQQAEGRAQAKMIGTKNSWRPNSERLPWMSTSCDGGITAKEP